MKQFMTVILTGILCIFLLASCGADGKPVSTDTGSEGTGNAADTEKVRDYDPYQGERKTVHTVEIETEPVYEGTPLDDPSLYCAGPKEPEVYDPNAAQKTFRIISAAHSDGVFAVVYGECAMGALVTCETADGVNSVQSVGGCFAMRVRCLSETLEGVFTQSYNGEQIGEELNYKGKLVYSSYENDPSWCAMIGYNNQGFFQKMLPDFQGQNLLDADTIKNLTDKFTKRVEAMKGFGENGCELICILVPASMTTYEDLVPEQYQRATGITKFDQIVKLLRDAGVTVLDERNTFRAHKYDALPLYYKYDSHWTDYGAYLAYVDLFDYISDRFPDAAPRRFDEFEWNWGWYTEGDMPLYFDVDTGGKIYEYTVVRKIAFSGGMANTFKKVERYINPKSVAYTSYSDLLRNGTTYSTGRKNLPSMHVFRSSYGSQIFDILPERCNKTVYQSMFSYAFNAAAIKKEQVDYVVYLLSEWNFDEILNS